MSDIWHDPLFLAALKKGGAGGSVSGDIVTFNTPKAAPLRALTLSIDPVQDLHGYDAPWPGGGGKNKWHLYANGYYNNNGGFSPSGANGCSDKIPVTAGATYVFGSTKATTETLTIRGYFFDENDAIVGSQIVGTSGSKPVSFTAPSGAVTVALWFSESGWTDTMTQTECDRLGMQMETGSSLTTYAPYSNICPISGWSSANLWRTGRNLLDLSFLEFDDSTYSHAYYPATTSQVTEYAKLMERFIGKTVVLSATVTGTQSAGTQPIGTIRLVNSSGDVFQLRPDTPATVPDMDYSNVSYLIIYGSANGASASDIQLELGTTPTPYTPYTGTTIPITWEAAGTVYGGVWDVLAGVLRVDAVLEVFNAVGPEGNIISNIGLEFLGSSGSVSDLGDVVRVSMALDANERSKYNLVSSSYDYKMCNMLRHYFSYNDPTAHWYRNTVLYLYFPKSLVGDTVNSVRDYLISIKDTTPLSLWIPLATPIEYTLTAAQLDTLAGQNVAWGDSGEVSLEYAGGGVSKDMMLAAILHEARQ